VGQGAARQAGRGGQHHHRARCTGYVESDHVRRCPWPSTCCPTLQGDEVRRRTPRPSVRSGDHGARRPLGPGGTCYPAARRCARAAPFPVSVAASRSARRLRVSTTYRITGEVSSTTPSRRRLSSSRTNHDPGGRGSTRVGDHHRRAGRPGGQPTDERGVDHGREQDRVRIGDVQRGARQHVDHQRHGRRGERTTHQDAINRAALGLHLRLNPQDVRGRTRPALRGGPPQDRRPAAPSLPFHRPALRPVGARQICHGVSAIASRRAPRTRCRSRCAGSGVDHAAGAVQGVNDRLRPAMESAALRLTVVRGERTNPPPRPNRSGCEPHLA
jgi:hypothetical protein